MDALFGFPLGRRSFILGQISEPSTNSLRLLLLEAAPQGPVVEVDDLGIPGQEILPISETEALAVEWPSYVSYVVFNESYALPEPKAPKGEHMLRERGDSWFRDFIRTATWASDDYPGKLRHFSVFCEHHCIDVISTEPPSVTRTTVNAEQLMRQTARVFNRA